MIRGLRRSLDWLVTHISISLPRGRVNLSASAHAQQDSISKKDCVWLAGAKEFKGEYAHSNMHIFHF